MRSERTFFDYRLFFVDSSSALASSFLLLFLFPFLSSSPLALSPPRMPGTLTADEALPTNSYAASVMGRSSQLVAAALLVEQLPEHNRSQNQVGKQGSQAWTTDLIAIGPYLPHSSLDGADPDFAGDVGLALLRMEAKLPVHGTLLTAHDETKPVDLREELYEVGLPTNYMVCPCLFLHVLISHHLRVT